MRTDIYQFIKSEENNFQTNEIQVGDNWNWNFRKFVQMIFHLKNGQFFTGTNGDWLRAFKNIMEPILNLSYWMEDIEVKDAVFFIENEFGRVLSFLLKKYHDEVYVKKHDLDTLFDEITESDVDYGGTLVQDADTPQGLEVLPLNTIAFCDQTDIMSGVIGFKYSFSPSKLRAMSKVGWGNEKNGATISIEDLIVLATQEKDVAGSVGQMKNKTTGKNIDVYIVRGDMPEHYLKDNNDMETYYPQLQIVAFYTDKNNKKEGVTLYRQKVNGENMWFHTSKKVTGRALGRGMGEALLHSQVWENFLTIHKMNALEAGSKSPLWTDDENFTDKNKIKDQENLEMNVIGENKRIGLIPTLNPAQIQLFSNSINEWYEHAQLTGSAFDPVLGKEAASGTTFRGQERVVSQGRGLHERRRGQRAKFLELLYREKFIPDMVKEIKKGKEFLSTLTTDEMGWVADRLATNYANEKIIDLAINDKYPTNEEKEMLIKKFKQDFAKKGNKHLLKAISKDFDGVEVKMGINIAGKQKDLAGLSDKVLSIIQFAFQDPNRFQQTFQIPGMTNALNDVLEFSGISPVDFATVSNLPIQSPIQPQQLQQLTA